MSFAGSAAMGWIEILKLVGFVAAAIVFAEAIVRLWIDPEM
jgi:hypothetical protein